MTARDEKIVIQQETILLDAPGFIFVDANNFFNPSRQSYLRFVYFRRMDNKNVTYRKFNSIKIYAGKQNGSFLLHITLLHFTKIFSESKNESIRYPSHICKSLFSFKD